MKCARGIGLLTAYAVLLLTFATTASATILTSPTGTPYSNEIHATAGQTTLHGVSTITCESSTIKSSIETQGSSTTAHGQVNTLTLSNCGANHVQIVSKGTLIFHTDPDSPNSENALVTSSGATITFNITPLGITCGFKTEETTIGTLTSSEETKNHADIDIDSIKLSRHAGSPFCGSSTEWTGYYTVTTPSILYVD